MTIFMKIAFLSLAFIASSKAEFMSPYANATTQTPEERLQTTALASVELQKEIDRKKAIEKVKRKKAQKIKDAKIAKSFTKESDLKNTEKKMLNIAKGEKVEFKKAPIQKPTAPVNLAEDDFFDSMKSTANETMKME